MVLESNITKVAGIANSSSIDIIHEIGRLGLWLQTIGLIVIIWIVFQSIAFALNRKRLKEIHEIRNDMQRIEGKIDKIISKKK